MFYTSSFLAFIASVAASDIAEVRGGTTFYTIFGAEETSFAAPIPGTSIPSVKPKVYTKSAQNIPVPSLSIIEDSSYCFPL